MKKKICSMMLVAVMITAIFPSAAFAQDNVGIGMKYTLLADKVSENFSDVEFQEMYEESAVLSQEFAFFNELLVNIEKGNDGDYIFELDYGYTTNEIQIVQENDEKTIIEIVDNEMNICNIMECYKDGRTIIDGFEVSSATETVVKPRVSSNWWTQTCPYGKPVDYSVSAGHKENKNIPLGNKIEKITVTAFIKICIPVIGKAVSKVYENLYGYLKGANPGATAFSYKADLYYHKNQRSGGYIPAANMYVTRYNYTWYPKINFGGTNRYETWYDCTRLG